MEVDGGGGPWMVDRGGGDIYNFVGHIEAGRLIRHWGSAEKPEWQDPHDEPNRRGCKCVLDLFSGVLSVP